ncbi:hypothetical protein QAD02_014208 [Eretmocerus hayati]|uniref:Uncharacterized protein n=1 Tax=Eretmocerus hayati TaxID=131215 RepID=A0ACC2P5Y8_9HYME|nr:hypothetical protein QAD02_014208 [Eretmocerus hayati]
MAPPRAKNIEFVVNEVTSKLRLCIERMMRHNRVFDYDWGLQDDFMGAAMLDLTKFDLGRLQDITLELKDPARPNQYLGEILISATLWPKNQQEKEQECSEFFPPIHRVLFEIRRNLESYPSN